MSHHCKAKHVLAVVALAIASGGASPGVATAQDSPRTFVPNACMPPEFRVAWGWCGDGGPATSAVIREPRRVTAWPDGAFAFSSDAIAVIRKVNRQGIIDVAAGTGTVGFSGDGGPATRARISTGVDVAALRDGGLLIADIGNHRVRHVGTDGIIRTVAGTGRGGLSGDGGRAVAAQLDSPSSVDGLAEGGFVVVDSGNARVRRVAQDGTISTVVTGRRGGGSEPVGVAAVAGGGFVVADDEGRVRHVAPTGAITTIYNGDGLVRGVTTLPNGSPALLEDEELQAVTPPRGSIKLGRCPEKPPPARYPTGDGGPVERAFMRATDAAPLPDGSMLVSDRIFQRIRKIAPDMRVATAAGGGGLVGRVPTWVRCEQAGTSSGGPWDLFTIRGVRVRRGVAKLLIGTSLPARATLHIKRGRRPLEPRRYDLDPKTRELRVGRIRPGRYSFVLRAKRGSLRATAVLRNKRLR